MVSSLNDGNVEKYFVKYTSEDIGLVVRIAVVNQIESDLILDFNLFFTYWYAKSVEKCLEMHSVVSLLSKMAGSGTKKRSS